ncbi:speckle-type POZ protein B-like [Nasonia vitripennis]|uniref:BTB domain-containing protein n=1 Tax=Nasonia vitripennis TaxID=7425 RepID=A0A7M7H409_NASVI|nr:speckle-type POZ protein B-like [Nasonia vitripennis]
MGKNLPLPTNNVFDIFVFKDKSSVESKNLSHEISLRLEEFDDFENLLNDRDFGDLNISIEDKTVIVHKCILAKRSPVFAAMFRSDMKELRNNAVEIKDIKYGVFMEMLRFIYSGKVHRLEAIAMDLLVAADMYQLENLKILCGVELVKQLSVEDAVCILKLADKCHVEALKKQAIEYIVQNRKCIFDQTAFSGLSRELTYEICQAMK